jgi:hypothetical protein
MKAKAKAKAKAKSKAIYDAELRETKRCKDTFFIPAAAKLPNTRFPHYPIIFSFFVFFLFIFTFAISFFGDGPTVKGEFSQFTELAAWILFSQLKVNFWVYSNAKITVTRLLKA